MIASVPGSKYSDLSILQRNVSQDETKELITKNRQVSAVPVCVCVCVCVCVRACVLACVRACVCVRGC